MPTFLKLFLTCVLLDFLCVLSLALGLAPVIYVAVFWLVLFAPAAHLYGGFLAVLWFANASPWAVEPVPPPREPNPDIVQDAKEEFLGLLRGSAPAWLGIVARAYSGSAVLVFVSTALHLALSWSESLQLLHLGALCLMVRLLTMAAATTFLCPGLLLASLFEPSVRYHAVLGGACCTAALVALYVTGPGVPVEEYVMGLVRLLSQLPGYGYGLMAGASLWFGLDRLSESKQ